MKKKTKVIIAVSVVLIVVIIATAIVLGLYFGGILSGAEKEFPKNQTGSGSIDGQEGNTTWNITVTVKNFKLKGLPGTKDGTKGIISYNGSQICSQNWTQTNAKIFCQQIHPNSPVVAALPRIDVIRNENENNNNNKNNNNKFMNIEFDCDGTEKNISECPNRISSQPCGSSIPAGVTCLWQSVELRIHPSYRGSSSEGALFIDGVPVCGNNWTRSMSLAICQRLDGPNAGVIKTEYRSLSAPATLGLDCVMKRDADERRFMDCDVDVKDGSVGGGSCAFKNQPWIVCSPCNDDAIRGRVKKAMKAAEAKNNTIDEVMEVFKESKAWLETKCRFECAGKMPFGGDCDKCDESEYCSDGKRLGFMCQLEKQGSPECTFDLALKMMPKLMERVRNESRPRHLPALDLPWQNRLDVRKHSEVPRSWVVESNLIALMEFWTFIDDDPKFQALWLNRSRELDHQLETTRYYEIGYSKQDIQHFKQLLNHMNESRELQLGRHQGDTKDLDRLEVISNEMAKLSGEMEMEMDTSYRRLIEKEITDLYNYMRGDKWGAHGRFMREINLRKACTLYEYMNGGTPATECIRPNSNTIPGIGSKIDDWQMCQHREHLERRSVVIPARWPSADGTVEEGTVNLSDLFGEGLPEGDPEGHPEKWWGKAKFRIPNMDWLLKHRWISAEEKEKGPFFLREFNVIPMPLKHSYNTAVDMGSPHSLLGNKNYTWYDDYRYRYRYIAHSYFKKFRKLGSLGRQLNPENPYSTDLCEEKLEKYGTSNGYYSFGRVLPSVFTPWIISHNRMKEEWAKPYADGPFYLKAYIQICFGSVNWNQNQDLGDKELEEERIRRTPPRLNPEFAKCCSKETNTYFDLLAGKAEYSRNDQPSDYELCPACPKGSVARLNGYYCEKCPKGKRLAEASDLSEEADRCGPIPFISAHRNICPLLPMGCLPENLKSGKEDSAKGKETKPGKEDSAKGKEKKPVVKKPNSGSNVF